MKPGPPVPTNTAPDRGSEKTYPGTLPVLMLVGGKSIDQNFCRFRIGNDGHPDPGPGPGVHLATPDAGDVGASRLKARSELGFKGSQR